jgi:hypothetical protein
VAALVASLVVSTSASADAWFPHPPNAEWNYTWTDSQFNKSGTSEKVTVCNGNSSDQSACQGAPTGCGWTLAWNSTGSQTSSGSGSVSVTPDSGTMCFQDANYGLLNTDWTSSSPPSGSPILCPWTINPQTGNPCANSLSSALFNVIWGARAPVLWEPLLQGTTWGGTGGAYNDVTSSNQYMGLQTVKVPAFPNGVTAAVVDSQIEASGDLGDPYGAGSRTTWWVYGVGPVKVVFDHAGGIDPPVTIVNLTSTNLRPLPSPADENYFPLRQGQTHRYKWTNNRHLPQPEIEKVTTAAIANGSARFTIQSVNGPIRTIGNYGFTVRLDGVVDNGAAASAATLLKFPPLGRNRHFFTPFDLMEFGLDPILPAYPSAGMSWTSQKGSADYRAFDVTGKTTVIGVRNVRVPAGKFQALELKSVLHQPFHRFGSGTRYSWFAPGVGLVKLIFRHNDHSVSTVVLLK